MSEILILYILNKYDCTIYKIMKLIDEIFFAFTKTSAGTINPAIKRLEDLSCVEYKSKMSDGGMLSKIYSITSAGKKHLINLLLSYTTQNPAHVLNEAKMLLYCCEVLNSNEMIEFKNNLKNTLQLYEIKLEHNLEDEYNQKSILQKKILETTLSETKELVELL